MDWSYNENHRTTRILCNHLLVLWGREDIYFYGSLFFLFKDDCDNDSFCTLVEKTDPELPAFQHCVCVYVFCVGVAGSTPISRTFPCWQYFVTLATRYLYPKWVGLFICPLLSFPAISKFQLHPRMTVFFICQASKQYLSISLLLAFKWSLIYNSSLVYHSGLHYDYLYSNVNEFISSTPLL